MKKMNKPKVFVASSVEGLDIAYHVQTNLMHDCDCTVWPQGVFKLSTSPLDSLTNQLDGTDFAIFVFSPDDEVTMRGGSERAVRDNVLFELGLFCGRLGKQRCFIISPDAPEMHIPTDLIGVTPATYSAARDVEEMAATIGPACHQIRIAMKKLGRQYPEAPASKIPVSESDSYDDEDKIILLSDWVNTANTNIAYKFFDVDNELKLDHGTTKRLLSTAVGKFDPTHISQQSNHFFTLAD